MIVESRVSSGNVLMDLRIVILRTIATVWEDDKNKPQKTIRERLNDLHFSAEDIKELLNNDFFKKNIDSVTPLREILVNFEPKFIIEYFKSAVRYHTPFENFGVKFIPGSAKWNLYGDDEWTKPDGETISLVLPSCEELWDSYQRAYYLMEFYHFFPNFFGSRRKEEFQITTSPFISVMGTSEVRKVTPQDNSGIDFSGNDYHLGVAEDNFLGFGALMNKVIAAAWNRKEFKDEIDYDTSKKNEKSDKDYYKSIASILKEHFDFEMPWEFNLKLQFARTYNPDDKNPTDSKAPFWTGSGKNWSWYTTKEKQLIRNAVSLEIPMTPDNKENVSLALARYNLIGPKYPFTCS